MRAVDTNVLVRLIVRDDADQTAAAEAYTGAGAWASHLVLLETLWVLESLYEKKRHEIGDVVEGLLDHKTLILQDADVVASAADKMAPLPQEADALKVLDFTKALAEFLFNLPSRVVRGRAKVTLEMPAEPKR